MSPHATWCQSCSFSRIFVFFFNDPATTEIYTLSLHDALPISRGVGSSQSAKAPGAARRSCQHRRLALRSEEHTSELQSLIDLVCPLLLEKRNRARSAVGMPGPEHQDRRARLQQAAPGQRCVTPPVPGVSSSCALG